MKANQDKAPCGTCGSYCTSPADCAINVDLARDGVDPAVYRNPVPDYPQDETARIAREHEAAFTALSEAEQARQYARAEQGTAGAWLGTYSS